MTPLPSTVRSAWLRWALCLASAAAAAVSAALLAVSVGGAASERFAQVCGALGGDCAGALSSPWAYVGPLPAALFGLAYFGFVSVWYGLAGLPNWAGRLRHLQLGAVVAAGAAGSGFYLWVMLTGRAPWCPLCSIAHVLNGFVLLGTIAAWPRRPAATSDNWTGLPQPSFARIAGVMLLSVLLFGNGLAASSAWYYYQVAGHARGVLLEATNNADFIIWRHGQSSLIDFPLRPDDPAAGPARAPHTLVVFMDFQCPHCREFESFGNELIRSARGRLRIVFKHYPMSRACCEQLPSAQNIHPSACDAATAYEAARRLDPGERSWRYRDLLFRRQAEFASRPWARLAAEVGLDGAAFAAAMASGDLRERIAEDAQLGRRLELDGAGAMFLDGRRLYTYRVTTTDWPPRIDTAKTLAMWERLLGR